MARAKTCFASSICCSDDFLDMPPSARALYLHLGLEADNDGVIANVKSLMRQVQASNDDLSILTAKGYLISVENLYVIRDWWINNNQDRSKYRPGDYKEIISILQCPTSGEHETLNGAYFLPSSGVPHAGPKEGHKVKEGKVIEDKINEEKVGDSTPSLFANEVIEYLNEKTGRRFKPTTGIYVRAINARTREGYLFDDFKLVIDYKTAEWLGNKKMECHLTPDTLFGTKFDKYTNQAKSSKEGISNAAFSEYTNAF